MTKRLAIFVLLSILAFGCAAPPIDWTNPQEVSSRIYTKYDNFTKVTVFVGPNLKYNDVDWYCTSPEIADTPKG